MEGHADDDDDDDDNDDVPLGKESHIWEFARDLVTSMLSDLAVVSISLIRPSLSSQFRNNFSILLSVNSANESWRTLCLLTRVASYCEHNFGRGLRTEWMGVAVALRLVSNFKSHQYL